MTSIITTWLPLECVGYIITPCQHYTSISKSQQIFFYVHQSKCLLLFCFDYTATKVTQTRLLVLILDISSSYIIHYILYCSRTMKTSLLFSVSYTGRKNENETTNCAWYIIGLSNTIKACLKLTCYAGRSNALITTTVSNIWAT